MARLGGITLLTLPLLTACTSSLVNLRENLDVHRSSFEEKLADDSVKVERFRTCIQQVLDGTSLPLNMATEPAATRSVMSPIMIGGRLRALVQALGDILEYATHHEQFPHEPTSDRFFDQSEFESYRRLGEPVATEVFASVTAQATTLPEIFDSIHALDTPSLPKPSVLP